MSEDHYIVVESIGHTISPVWYVKEHVPGANEPRIVALCFKTEDAERVKRALELLDEGNRA